MSTIFLIADNDGWDPDVDETWDWREGNYWEERARMASDEARLDYEKRQFNEDFQAWIAREEFKSRNDIADEEFRFPEWDRMNDQEMLSQCSGWFKDYHSFGYTWRPYVCREYLEECYPEFANRYGQYFQTEIEEIPLIPIDGWPLMSDREKIFHLEESGYEREFLKSWLAKCDPAFYQKYSWLM